MIKHIVLIVFILTTTLVSARTKPKTFELNFSKNGHFSMNTAGNEINFGNISGHATLYDAKLKKHIKLAAPRHIHTPHSDQLVYHTAHFDWILTFTPRRELYLVKSTIKNLSREALWLEPGIKLSASKIAVPRSCWDGGSTITPLNNKPLFTGGLKGKVEKHVGASRMPFPVAALIKDNFAIFAGAAPFTPVSYFCSSFAPDQETASLTFSVRTVVDPNYKVEFEYVIGATPTPYGEMQGIVQSSYDSLPDYWAPVVGQDNPYIWGNHGHYLNIWKKPNFQVARRLFVTLDWTYCPYKRSGDIYGHKELWNYTPKNAFKEKGLLFAGEQFKFQELSWKDFHKKRDRLYNKYGREFGLMFFNSVTGTWADIQLAQEKYPDSINHDTDHGVRKILTSWSTHHDHEIRMFPYGTSFAKALERDSANIVKRLHTPGFAFDCSYAGAYYRGPATKKKLQGKAWDEKGVFIDQSIAINHLADFTHNLGNENNPAKKQVVWSNGYLKGDYIMFERAYLDITAFNNSMPNLRYLIGPRPGSTHKHGYMIKNTVPDWRSRKKAFFKELFPKLGDYVIMSQYKYGLTTSHLTQYGVPQVLYNTPEVIELMRAGWQAEIPMTYHAPGKELFKARYGQGASSYLFLGNPYPDDIKTPVTVGNSSLGDLDYLFAKKMRDQAATTNIIQNGKTTLQAHLKSRTPHLWEAVCGLNSPVTGLKAQVSSKKDIHTITHTIKFQQNQPFSTPLETRKLYQFKLDSIMINCKNIPFTKDGLVTNCEIPTNATLVLSYKSTIYNIPAKSITDFPFVNNSKNISFTVAIPENPNKTETSNAEKFVGYFEFCKQKKIINPKSSKVKIKNIKEIPATGNTILLLSGKKRLMGVTFPYGVSSPRPGLIVINTKEWLDAYSIVKSVQHVMDRRFEYNFPFAPVMGVWRELPHMGLKGYSFPYRRYFENAKQEGGEK